MAERKYWGVLRPMPAAQIATLARQMEDMGLAGVFAPQVLGPPWIPLAAAATRTERLALASGVAIAAARSPFETAMAAIDMDRLSEGRFVLGLGSSVLAWSRGVFGAPEHQPIRHLRETVHAVRHIVRGAHRGLEPFEGEYYHADFAELQAPPPPVREEIPIWIAALRAAAVRAAGEIADGLIGHPVWSVEWAVERIQRELDKGLAAGQRRREDIEVNLWFWCAPNEDESEALEDSRPTVAFYAGMEQYEPFFEAHGFGEEARRLQPHVKARAFAKAASLVPDEMVRTFVMAGKPDDVGQRVERAWSVADSMCLVPPMYAVSPERLAKYANLTAELFYG